MTTPPSFDPSGRIAESQKLPLASVRAVLALLDEKATVPFMARYRKEQTGGLDEVQIRAIVEQNEYLVEVHDRRVAILREIESQGKLTPALRAQIEACWVKGAIEDLYAPYKPKRRTRAKMARERGLEPLADVILAQPSNGAPEAEARKFVDVAKGVPDTANALAGARDIVAEVLADAPPIRASVRDAVAKSGVFACTPVKAKTKEPTKFETYYGFSEKVTALASHRYLAICRGEEEGVLRAGITVDRGRVAQTLTPLAKVRPASPFSRELIAALDDALERLLLPSIESDVRGDLKERADRDSIAIFADNLRGLLLQPALGKKAVLGIDPGQRTGCKCAALDETGQLVEHALINLVQGDAAVARAKTTLLGLVKKHKPAAIAVGNGTHGRETADFCRDALAAANLGAIIVVMVSESGASVYSASDVAREEFPDLDLTVRGAISIGRRLQDPLAELVKVDPKAIGVGQYQHDVNQPLLKRKLDEIVESCVNAVGVELNTASAPLLAHVAGVGPAIAKKIVGYRNENGAFRSRKQLLKVPGLGPKAFEQCAGFVRVRDGEHPLDASAVHPERYALVERIAKDANVPVRTLVGDAERVKSIAWKNYVNGDVGMPTLEDIQRELAKPGRDPRSAFEAPAFKDDVRKIEDLAAGMQMEGVVTNVTAFGAFVDLGVHQDGLIHVSQLADRFVRDPREVVKVGDKVSVRVLEVDLARKRISLSARSQPARS